MKGDEEGEGERGVREKGKRNIPVRHLLCRNFGISPFSFNRLKKKKKIRDVCWGPAWVSPWLKTLNCDSLLILNKPPFAGKKKRKRIQEF